MFDLSWIELGFCAALALLIMGPKDLPKLIRLVGQTITKAKRTINQVKGSFKQLEDEINITDNPNQHDSWTDLLPEEVRHLPKDFMPGSLSKEQHEDRKKRIEDAKATSDKQTEIEQP